jgi:tetratricopeptide (TPR) repeat protein
MSRNRWIQIAFMLVACACLAGAASLVPSINKQRIELQLNPGAEIGESLPPHIAVATAALGPFRGFLVDMLWHRANYLQTEGKYYEANTLSNWITTLQPRFGAVWVFQSWNMSYNISVATHTKEERWDWVNKGIQLLRDKGIVLNPDTVYLYREIAWTFWHKIAAISDDAHWYYKAQLAEEWQQIMGTSNIGATAEQTIEAFRAIATAPDTVEQLIAEDPKVGALLDEFAAMDFGVDSAGKPIMVGGPNRRFLEYLGQLAMHNFTAEPIFIDLPMLVRPMNMMQLHPRLPEILQDEQWVAPIRAFLAFVRRQVLINDYHMDPQRMLDTMETYGPLDWRHACSHALYWAMAGVQRSDQVRFRDFREMTQFGNTMRLNVMSIDRLMRTGKLSFDVVTGYVGLQPDVRFIPYYDKAMERAIKSMEGDESMVTVIKSYYDGHENYLLRLVYFLFLWGDEEQAEQFFRRAEDLYGQEKYHVSHGTFTNGVEEFVLNYLKQNKDSMVNVRQFIDASVRRGIEDGLLVGEMERWEYVTGRAKKMHEHFQKEMVTTTIDKKQNRNALPAFPAMVSEIYVNYMQTPTDHPEYKHRIWVNTPLKIRRETYDRLKQPLAQLAKRFQLDFETFFQKPAGMAPAPRPTFRGSPQGQPMPPRGPQVERN